VFFICDESSPYIENVNLIFEKIINVGQAKDVEPHYSTLFSRPFRI